MMRSKSRSDRVLQLNDGRVRRPSPMQAAGDVLPSIDAVRPPCVEIPR